LRTIFNQIKSVDFSFEVKEFSSNSPF